MQAPPHLLQLSRQASPSALAYLNESAATTGTDNKASASMSSKSSRNFLG